MLQQLEYLVALAEHRHFGRAAAACHVTQPALSKALLRLERELDVVIVRRGRRFEGFTAEGERILTWAHRILAERREMVIDVGRMRGGITATARIGSIPTAVAAVPFLTREFRRVHPDAVCQVMALPSRELSHLLTDFELDAAVTYLDDETPPSATRLELYRERYVLIAPEDHPVMAVESIDWTSIAELPLCALTHEMRNRRIIEARVAQHGARLRPVIEANTVGALFTHLSGDGLCAVVAHPWVHALALPPGTRARPIEDTQPAPSVGLIVLDRTRSSMIADAILAAASRAAPHLQGLHSAAS